MAVEDVRVIKRAALSFLVLVLAMLWVPVAVLLDVVVIGHGMPELSVTEISQEMALLVSSVLMYALVLKLPAQRGFLLLVRVCYCRCLYVSSIIYLIRLATVFGNFRLH